VPKRKDSPAEFAATRQKHGRCLRFLLARNGTSQTEWASRVGLTAPRLSQLLAGRTRLDGVLLDRLLTTLGCDFGDWAFALQVDEALNGALPPTDRPSPEEPPHGPVLPLLAASRNLSRNRLAKDSGLGPARIGHLFADEFDALTPAERSRCLVALRVTEEQLTAVRRLFDGLKNTGHPPDTVPISRPALEAFLASLPGRGR
jgi:plasmid maintenance system antidote protein VapI